MTQEKYYAIGPDFGTSCTKIAAMVRKAQSEMIKNSQGMPSTPSVAFVLDDGSILTGRIALSKKLTNPDRFISNPKRFLEQDTPALTVNGKDIYFIDICREIIRQPIDDMKQTYGQNVKYAVVTCPANASSKYRTRLLQIYKEVGLEVSCCVNEPTAASFSLDLPNGKVVILDCGSGTTDVTIMEINGQRYTVLGTHGIAKRGGSDFTKALLDYELDLFKKECGFLPDPQKFSQFYLDLEYKVEQDKILLSTAPFVTVYISAAGKDVTKDISRQEYESITKPHVQDIVSCVKEAIKKANVQPSECSFVAIGGASRDPAIKSALEKEFNASILVPPEPEYVVAYGAAMICHSKLDEMGKNVIAADAPDLLLPSPVHFMQQEKLAKSLGLIAYDKKCTFKQFVTMVPEGTDIPVSVSKKFGLMPGQNQASITIVQGYEGAALEETVELGKTVIDVAKSAESERIEIRFDINVSGVVEIKVIDLVSKKDFPFQASY